VSEEQTNGVLRYRLEEVEKDFAEYRRKSEEKMDKIIMTMVVAAFSLAGAILMLGINLIVLRGR
jgi:hypothetical protein